MSSFQEVHFPQFTLQDSATLSMLSQRLEFAQEQSFVLFLPFDKTILNLTDESAHVDHVPQTKGQLSFTSTLLHRFASFFTQLHDLILFLPLAKVLIASGESEQDSILHQVGGLLLSL